MRYCEWGSNNPIRISSQNSEKAAIILIDMVQFLCNEFRHFNFYLSFFDTTLATEGHIVRHLKAFRYGKDDSRGLRRGISLNIH